MSLVECMIESSSLDALYLWRWDDGAGYNLILGALFADLVIQWLDILTGQSFLRLIKIKELSQQLLVFKDVWFYSWVPQQQHKVESWAYIRDCSGTN